MFPYNELHFARHNARGVILQTPGITNVTALVGEVSDVTAVVVWRDDPMRF